MSSYKKMAKEVNWVPPSNIHVDPRMTSGNERTAEKFRCAKRSTPAFLHQHGNSAAARHRSENVADFFEHIFKRLFQVDRFRQFHPNQWLRRGRQKPWLPLRQQKRRNNKTTTRKQALPPHRRTPNPDPNALMEMTTQVSSFSDSPPWDGTSLKSRRATPKSKPTQTKC